MKRIVPAAASVAAMMLGIALPVPAQVASGWESASWQPHMVVLRTGYGDEKTLDIGVHARWPAGTVDWLPGQPRAFVEGGLDYWGSTTGGPGPEQLVALSVAYGLRWYATPAWFVDFSGGPYLLSRTQLKERDFGVALQWGVRLAGGIAFGEDRRHEVAAYVEHASNARVSDQNRGIEFFGVEYRYTFR